MKFNLFYKGNFEKIKSLVKVVYDEKYWINMIINKK